MAEVTDNPARSRYELEVEGETAFVSYRWEGRNLVFEHTEVPQNLSGQGIGSALARSVLEKIRGRGVQVVPECEFMASYINRHPEFASLVARFPQE